MLRYVPNRAMVEDGGCQLIRQEEYGFYTDCDLTSDALRLFSGTSSDVTLRIQDITRLFLVNKEREFRSPPYGYRGGTPLYYGSYKVSASKLTLITSILPKMSHYTIGVHHTPVCELDGREWRPLLPDEPSRQRVLHRIHSLYKTLGPAIRQRHIEDACSQLQNGHEVTDCAGNLVFYPHGATLSLLKSGFFAAMLGRRDTFHCKYEDVIVKHTGDAYFPEHVIVQFRGQPDATCIFTAHDEAYSPFLIKPIVEMMTTGKGPHTQHKVQPAQTIIERLRVLDELLSTGSITPSEHAEKRRSILEGL